MPAMLWSINWSYLETEYKCAISIMIFPLMMAIFSARNWLRDGSRSPRIHRPPLSCPLLGRFRLIDALGQLFVSSILTASGARYELTGLVKESLDVTLATLPMLHGQAPDVAYKAEGGEGGVKKEGEQAATVSQVTQGRRHVLRRH